MIFLRILVILFFLAEIVFVIKRAVEYNTRYKSAVDFLRKENDSETLSAIGYVEFYGEEYGMRKSFSLTDALLQLYARYNETGKSGYLEYAEYLESAGKYRVPLAVLWLLTPVLLGIAFGER